MNAVWVLDSEKDLLGACRECATGCCSRWSCGKVWRRQLQPVAAQGAPMAAAAAVWPAAAATAAGAPVAAPPLRRCCHPPSPPMGLVLQRSWSARALGTPSLMALSVRARRPPWRELRTRCGGLSAAARLTCRSWLLPQYFRCLTLAVPEFLESDIYHEVARKNSTKLLAVVGASLVQHCVNNKYISCRSGTRFPHFQSRA